MTRQATYLTSATVTIVTTKPLESYPSLIYGTNLDSLRITFLLVHRVRGGSAIYINVDLVPEVRTDPKKPRSIRGESDRKGALQPTFDCW